jgi:hypothetical protein
VFRLTPIRALIVALLFLAGAVGAVALAQFAAAPWAPLICWLYAAAAVAFAIVAAMLRAEPARVPPSPPEDEDPVPTAASTADPE